MSLPYLGLELNSLPCNFLCVVFGVLRAAWELSKEGAVVFSLG